MDPLTRAIFNWLGKQELLADAHPNYVEGIALALADELTRAGSPIRDAFIGAETHQNG